MASIRLTRLGELARWLVPFCACSTGAFAFGCRAVIGVETTQVQSDDGGTCLNAPDDQAAGVGVGWWSGCGAADECYSAGTPEAGARPAIDAEGADIEPIVLAFDRIRLGSRDDAGKLDGEAWKTLGLDLDGVCTQASTCPRATTDAARACKPLLSDSAQDGDYCRDNQLGLLDYNLDTLEQTSGKYMATESQLNCALCRGGYNLITRISGYNGQPDDPSVRVDLYPSPGLGELKNVDCSRETWDEAGCFTESDAFSIDGSFLEERAPAGELGAATFYDPSAYVHDGWLVAQLPANTPFGLVSAHPEIPPVVRIAIQSGLFLAKLERGTEGWSMPTGLITGSTRLTSLLDEFARLGLCEESDSTTYVLIETFMESAADLLSSGARSPNTPCDALSLGIAVRGRAASPGEVVTVEPPSSATCRK